VADLRRKGCLVVDHVQNSRKPGLAVLFELSLAFPTKPFPTDMFDKKTYKKRTDGFTHLHNLHLMMKTIEIHVGIQPTLGRMTHVSSVQPTPQTSAEPVPSAASCGKDGYRLCNPALQLGAHIKNVAPLGPRIAVAEI
jgi:hypothetical protein